MKVDHIVKVEPSPDGQLLRITFAKDNEPVVLEMPADQVQPLVPLMLKESHRALVIRGGDPNVLKALSIYDIRLVEIPGLPNEVAIAVGFEPNGPRIGLRGFRDRVIHFAEDVLNRLAPTKLAQPAIADHSPKH